MHRLISFFLVIMMSMAIFIFQISSVDMPDNNVIADIDLYFGSATHDTGMHYSMSTGEVLYAYFQLSSGSSLNGQIITSLDLTLSRSATIYLICLSNQTFSSNPFDSYYDSTGNFSYTYTSASKVFTIDTSTTPHSYSVSDFTGSTNYVMSGYRYINVPAGRYSLVSSQASYAGRDFAIGIYVVSPVATFDDILSGVSNGSLSLSDGLSSINSIVENNVSSAQSSQDKLLALMQGQYYLSQLVLQSDSSILSQSSSFVSGLDGIISGFQSGSISLTDSITSFSDSFGSALSSAQTAEQGTLINTLYHLKFQQLRLAAELSAGERLDSAISDSEMSEVSDYYAAEDDLLAKFDIQKFKDALTFDLWFQQLDLVESNLYKSVFDRIINDSNIRFYVSVPLALLIVSVLLGTALRTNRKV